MNTTTQPRHRRLLPMSAPKRQPAADSVEKRVGFERSTLYRMISAGTFPRPVIIGGRSLWVEEELDEWIAERIAERDQQYANPSSKKL